MSVNHWLFNHEGTKDTKDSRFRHAPLMPLQAEIANVVFGARPFPTKKSATNCSQKE